MRVNYAPVIVQTLVNSPGPEATLKGLGAMMYRQGWPRGDDGGQTQALDGGAGFRVTYGRLLRWNISGLGPEAIDGRVRRSNISIFRL